MNKKTIKRRRSSAIIAAAAAVSLLVGGTFAWQSISQRAVNNTEGEPDWTGGRLHDDFMEEQNFVTGGNEDVYVENYSGYSFRTDQPDHIGRPVFVRVRLEEYMETGVGAGKFKVDSITGDPIGYQDLDQINFADNGTTGREEDTTNDAEPIISGTPADPTADPSILDLSTWYVHIPEGSAEDDGTDFHYYWEWDMGGSKIFLPTFNKSNDSLVADRTENTHTQYADGQVVNDNATYADGVSQPEDHVAKSTLETADVITMEEWLDLGSPTTDAGGLGYWVGDTDGWFYWSKALMPTDATGLLLNGTTLKNEPEEEWYYAIHVTSQMASVGAWGTDDADPANRTGFYEDGLTADAKVLLDQAAGITPTVSNVQIQEGRKVYVHAGDTITFTADVKVKNPTGDPNETLITWSVDNGGTITPNGKLTTTAADALKTYTVTASSAALPDVKSDTITVVVLPADAGDVVIGEDNREYLNLNDNTYQLINRNGTIDSKIRYWGADSIIGNSDDSLDVFFDNDGVKALGPDVDDAYITAGPDGLFGTGDDVIMKLNSVGNLSNSPVRDVAVGGTFTDDKGIKWQVLTEDSNGNKLIMTTASQATILYNTKDEWTPLEESNLMTDATKGLSNFYATKVGDNVKAFALPVIITDKRKGLGDPDPWNGAENGTTYSDDISSAGTGVPSEITAPFVLSIAEYNTYRSNIASSNNWWWLRTPGSDPNAPVSRVIQAGTVATYHSANVANSCRPALWVKS